MKWLDYIKIAMQNLGGEAYYSDLYEEIKKIRPLNFTPSWQATVRRTVEDHCPQSANYKGVPVFQHVGRGHYRLITTPKSVVIESALTDEEIKKKYGATGESEKHLTLKKYIANNPELIGIDKESNAIIEFPFPTGDRVDILFKSPKGIDYVVEIELSGENNLLIGAKQVVKYRVLNLIERDLNLSSTLCKGILVANKINYELVLSFCRKYSIDIYSINVSDKK